MRLHRNDRGSADKVLNHIPFTAFRVNAQQVDRSVIQLVKGPALYGKRIFFPDLIVIIDLGRTIGSVGDEGGGIALHELQYAVVVEHGEKEEEPFTLLEIAEVLADGGDTSRIRFDQGGPQPVLDDKIEDIRHLRHKHAHFANMTEDNLFGGAFFLYSSFSIPALMPANIGRLLDLDQHLGNRKRRFRRAEYFFTAAGAKPIVRQEQPNPAEIVPGSRNSGS